MTATDAKRVFELYVDELTGASETADDILIARLRYFAADVQQVSERLVDRPEMVGDLMQSLSRSMQSLDHRAGVSEAGHEAVAKARAIALLFVPSYHDGERDST